MDPGAFGEFKLMLIAAFNLPREAFHLLIGLVAHLGACVALRKPATWPGGLVAALAVGVLLELPDIRYNLTSLGRARWLASAKDLLHTALAPLLVVLSDPVRNLRPAARRRRR